MDINSLLTTMLSDESLAGVASQAGVKKKAVKSVLGSALPLLLSGAGTQSSDESTADGFAGALAQHAQDDTSDLGAFFKNVDLTDGAKIIAHLLGSSVEQQTSDVAVKAGVSTANTVSILSSVAPLLLSLLGQQAAKDNDKDAGVGALMNSLLGGGDVAGLVGQILGGGKKKNNLGILGKLFGLK